MLATIKVTRMELVELNNSPENNTESASIIPYHHRAIVASILVGWTTIGMFGNALVIIAVIVAKKLRTMTNILVVNLAIADFMSCVCIPFMSAGFLSQTRSYPLPEVICATVAGVMYTCVCCSGSTLVAIAIIRWFVITRSVRGHRGILAPNKIVIIVVFIWVESVALMVLPPVLGVGTLGYSEFYGMCFLTDMDRSKFYYTTLQATLIAIGLVLNLVFYTLILRHVLRHNRLIRDRFITSDMSVDAEAKVTQENKSNSSSSDSRASKERANEHSMEVRITKNLFTVVCFYVLCFLASAVNFAIPGSSVLTLYGYMILMFNSVVNPIIYGLKHPNFRDVFKNLLCCRRLTSNHVQPDIGI